MHFPQSRRASDPEMEGAMTGNTSVEPSEILFPKDPFDENPDVQRLLAEVVASSGEIGNEAVEALLVLLGKRFAMFSDKGFLEELVARKPDRPARDTVVFYLWRLTGTLRRAAWEWFTFHKSPDFAKVFQDETSEVYTRVEQIGDSLTFGPSESGPALAGFMFTVDGTACYVRRIAAQLRAGRSKCKSPKGGKLVQEPSDAGQPVAEGESEDGVGVEEAARVSAKPWEPSPGFVGVKTIMYDERFQKKGKNPPRTTIDAWIKSAARAGNPIRKEMAADSQEVHIPENWVHEQIRGWNPRT